MRPVRKALSLLIRFLTAALVFARRLEHGFVFRATAYFPQLRGAVPRTTTDMIEHYQDTLADQVARLPYRPRISILVPVYKVSPELLQETLKTVTTQVYENWELCVVDDASGDPKLLETISALAAAYPGRVHSSVNAMNAHISITSNRCLEMATGDYVALLDHDDRLLPNALAEMVRFINVHDRPEILYSDERVIDESGQHRHGPFHKPGWSPFLHLSVNYTTHLSVYSTALLRKIGGFRPGFEGSQDHDLMLRAVEASTKPVVHVPFVLYQWRAVVGSTARSAEAKPYAATAGVRAVSEACTRRGRPAEVTYEPHTYHYRVKFNLPAVKPLISIIIPTRDAPRLLGPCLESLMTLTTYPAFEVLVVDNGTTDSEALAILSRFKGRYPERFRVIRDDTAFNFGALNNLAAAAAKGEYLTFLNNDTEVRTPDWLDEMLRYGQFPEVGAVGCQLLYAENCLQHIGVLLADRRIACHALRTYPVGDHTYISMANTAHETAAVTAACMLLAKQKFLQVGGFDATYLPNGLGDVDLCLKLRRAGFSNVYTPYAILTHKESKTRRQTIELFEKQLMLARWGGDLMNDPYLNFNLERSEHYRQGEPADLDLGQEQLAAYWRRAQESKRTADSR